MVKQLKLTTSLMLFTCFVAMSQAQNTELNKHLSDRENRKLNSANKLIHKGDDIMTKVKPLEEEVDQLKNTDGKIKTRKINKRNKKIAVAKQKAALFYQDGYHKQLSVLDKKISALSKEGLQEEAGQIRRDVKQLRKKARKQYKKAEGLHSADSMIDLLDRAKDNQQKALTMQEQYLLTCFGRLADAGIEKEDTPTETVIPDSTSLALSQHGHPTYDESPADATPVTATTASLPLLTVETAPVPETDATVLLPVGANTESTEPLTDTIMEEVVTPTPTLEAFVEPETSIETETGAPAPPAENKVFLSIQILADKNKVEDEKLSKAYVGSLEIIEREGDGWHRYSVGRFSSTEKARQAMQDENIKGFIVAYNDKQRITVKEALDLLKR